MEADRSFNGIPAVEHVRNLVSRQIIIRKVTTLNRRGVSSRTRFEIVSDEEERNERWEKNGGEKLADISTREEEKKRKEKRVSFGSTESSINS